VHAVLDRHGLVQRRRRRRTSPKSGTGLSQPQEPNALWCADDKGEFMLRNRRYCYPLTITSTQAQFAFTVFERAFKEFGLPTTIRERMHLTLKREATKPAADNLLQQQARFDAFITRFNEERPHAALDMAVPASRYQHSPRPYRGLEDLTYPFHDATYTVTNCGRICFGGRKINLSHAFAGQNVGVTQVGERVWLVSFMQYDLGYFDDETVRVEPIDNPFGPKVLPMCSE
jgi:putative transposase